MVIAEDHFGEGEGTARVGIPVHQIGIVYADDQHDQRADQDAQRRAQRPRDGQEGIARHDEGAPADAAAEGQGPDRQRRQAANKPGSACAAFRSAALFIHGEPLFSLQWIAGPGASFPGAEPV